MPDPLDRIVRLVFEGVDNTGNAIAGVASGIQTVNNAALSVASPIANFAAKLLAIESAAFAAGAAIAVLASDKATEFEISFREVASLLDAPIDQLGDFRQAILDYAAGSTAGLAEIVASTYSAISAGVDYTESLDAVATAERLSIAGKADLGETLVGLVSTLNAYGLKMEDAGRISDIFFTTVRLGQTTIPELNASLADVTGIAATARIPFEEIGAAIATITAAGSRTASAVTQIQAAISALIKPSSEAETLAKSLGLEFNAQALATKGLKGVLDEAAAATGGNVEQMGILFGRVEALKGALTLSGTSAEKFTANLNAMQNATGATEAAAAKFADVLDTGKDATDILLISIGTPLIAAFYEARAAITDITNALSAAIVGDTGLKSLGSLMQELATDFAAAIRQIATNLPQALATADFSDFETGVRAVVNAIKDLFGGADLLSVEGLRTAIEKLGAGFLNLSEFTAAAINAVGPFIQEVAELLSEVEPLDSSFVTLAGSIGGFAIAANTILPVVNSLLLGFIALGGAGGALKTAGAALGSIGTVAAGAAAGLGTLGAAVGTTAAGLAAGVTASAALGGAVGTLAYNTETGRNFVNDFVDSITGLADESERALAPTQKMDEELLNVVKTSRDIKQGVDDYIKSLKDSRPEWQKQLDILDETNATNDKLTQSFLEQGLSYDAVTGKLTPLSEKLDAVSDTLKNVAESQTVATDEARGYRTIIDEATGKIIGYEQAGGKLAKSLTDTADAAKEATEKSDEFQLKLLEIASDERIKLIEAKVDLDIANIEADTQRIQAAFESINTSISSTGDVIGESIGALASIIDQPFGGRFSEQFSVFRDQIEAENRLRERSFDLQRDLTQAQIENLQARSESLRRGDALITIQGDGLEPELKSFMFAVLRAIQVEANAEFSEFLLGVNAA